MEDATAAGAAATTQKPANSNIKMHQHNLHHQNLLLSHRHTTSQFLEVSNSVDAIKSSSNSLNHNISSGPLPGVTATGSKRMNQMPPTALRIASNAPSKGSLGGNTPKRTLSFKGMVNVVTTTDDNPDEEENAEVSPRVSRKNTVDKGKRVEMMVEHTTINDGRELNEEEEEGGGQEQEQQVSEVNQKASQRTAYDALSMPKNQSMHSMMQSRSTINSRTSSGGAPSSRGSFASIGSNRSIAIFAIIYKKFEQWGLIDMFVAGMESIKVQILIGIILHLAVAALLIILITVIFNITLPYLSIYNLIQLLIGMLGKGLLTFAILLHQVCGKAMLAYEITGTSAINIITFKFGQFNPSRGRMVRRLFFVMLLVTEASLWLLQLNMEWAPITGSLGFYDCTLPSYPDEVTLKEVREYAKGDSSWSPVYAFGLPLGDGLIGGYGSWPREVPADIFTSVGDGFVFVVDVNCALPVIVDGTYMNNSTATTFAMISDNRWPRLYRAAVQVRYPAGSYKTENQSVGLWDITQECEIGYRVDAATIAYTFVLDNWAMVTLKQIDFVDIFIYNQPTYRITPRMDPPPYAAEVHNMLDISYTPTNSSLDNTTLFPIFTNWVANSVNIIFNESTVCHGNTASKMCRMLRWGSADGGQYYDLNKTDKGIAGLMAILSHYNLIQVNGQEMGKCQYWGQNGSGKINVSSGIVNLVLGLLGITLVLEFSMVMQVYMAIGSSEKHIDLAAKALDDPLRLLYLVRNTISTLVTTVTNKDSGRYSLRQHLEAVDIRLGEKKTSRGEAAGELSIGRPRETLKLRKARNYI